MFRGWPVLALLVAGCSERGRADGNAIDLAAAASEAEADIDNYAKAGGGTEDGDAAADAVRGTFAALADRRWSDARAGWHDPADVAPLRALRQRYDRILVRVGRPGGAGTRRMTVPVVIDGIGPGEKVHYRAVLGLRRGAGDDDWVIRSATVTPPDATLPAMAQATYDCRDGRVLAVVFDNRAGTATVSAGRDRWRLVQQRAASGIHYAGAGAGADLRGKGRAADWTVADHVPVPCSAR